MELQRKKVVLVDDDVTNLAVGKSILSPHYDLVTVPSGEKLFRLLEKTMPDLILLDIQMPKMDGYEVIKLLKAEKDIKNIPVIFLTAKTDSTSELEGLSLGAIDYIIKPFSPPLLLKRIELHLLLESQKQKLLNYSENLEEMVRRKTQEILQLQNSLLKTMANLVENRDEITGGHVERTRDYLEILVNAAMGREQYREEINSWDLNFFLQSSQLHDLGKIAIKDNILLKQGKLTEDEFNEMKKHTVFGVRIIEEIEKTTPETPFLNYAKILAGAHHEKWDGTGYPYGLSGFNIPLGGRLMAIADVYDALISLRPYKAPLSHEDAVRIISEGRGKQFDPDLVDIFYEVSPAFNAAVQKKSVWEQVA